MSVGELWAYRARQIDPLVCVRVARIGVNQPPRIWIRFVDEQFEGHEEWVPPGRLKAPWAAVEEFRSHEARWEVLLNASRVDEAVEQAARIVFEKLIDGGLAEVSYRNYRCAEVCIRDVDGLAGFLGISPDGLRAHPASFVEDDCLMAPWPITELIVTRACQRNPDPILRHVEHEESEAQMEAIHGRWHAATRTQDGWHLSPEHCAARDEEHDKPGRDLLRRWCGREGAERRDELHEVRMEVRRLGRLTDTAIEGLRRAGASEAADQIERDLGVPIEALRAPDSERSGGSGSGSAGSSYGLNPAGRY